MIVEAQKIIKGNDAGIRTQTGTTLTNQQTGDTIYTPLRPDQINDLEAFINNQFHNKLDPIIKMAIIHRQFESIHPFYDGNARIGRIINIICLIKHDEGKNLDEQHLELGGGVLMVRETKTDYNSPYQNRDPIQ